MSIKVWFRNEYYEEEGLNEQEIDKIIDYCAADEKNFIKCEITKENGEVETWKNGDYVA